jgi:hypothetical protein
MYGQRILKTETKAWLNQTSYQKHDHLPANVTAVTTEAAKRFYYNKDYAILNLWYTVLKSFCLIHLISYIKE